MKILSTVTERLLNSELHRETLNTVFTLLVISQAVCGDSLFSMAKKCFMDGNKKYFPICGS